MMSEQAHGEVRPVWFVGASFGRTNDQTARFLRDGIWVNGWEDRHLEDVRSIQPGDRIAIKAALRQKVQPAIRQSESPGFRDGHQGHRHCHRKYG